MIKKIFLLILPWRFRRILLIRWMHYEIHPTARIGYSWVYPSRLIMGAGAKIGHLNIAIHLDSMDLGINSSIARGNWITGFSSSSASKHFQHQPDRKSIFKLGNHSAITKNHHIDCTSPITIGEFVTIAGYQSQLLTHSIDIYENRQDSHEIIIGDFTFIGTNCVILGGSILPAYSVLGAKSLLNKAYDQQWKLYAGIPSKAIQDIPGDAKYFQRTTGFVY